jgi:hypothetical protein
MENAPLAIISFIPLSRRRKGTKHSRQLHAITSNSQKKKAPSSILPSLLKPMPGPQARKGDKDTPVVSNPSLTPPTPE